MPLTAATSLPYSRRPKKNNPALSDYEVTGIGEFDYDGFAKAVTVAVKTTGVPAPSNIKYTNTETEDESDEAPILPGTYAVTFDATVTPALTAWNNVLGIAAGEVVINKKDVDSATISGVEEKYYYAGKAITPTIEVKIGDVELIPEVDYTVEYSSNATPGTGKVTITGTGNYTGTKSVEFEIEATEPGAIVVIYWVDSHDHLISSASPIVDAGEEVIITAQSTGYTVKEWRVDGRKVTGIGDAYTFKSTDLGTHYVSLVVEKDGKVYSTTIPIRVE